MRNQKSLILAGASFLAISVILALFLHSKSGQDTQAPETGRQPVMSQRAEKPSLPNNGKHEKKINPEPPLQNPQASCAPTDKILEEIQDAAVSYNPSELPKIEPYLLHPDREIRQAAMNGMITLGDAAAGPLLRKAAALAPTPHEAVALIEAADYVELPPAKFRRRSK